MFEKYEMAEYFFFHFELKSKREYAHHDTPFCWYTIEQEKVLSMMFFFFQHVAEHQKKRGQPVLVPY